MWRVNIVADSSERAKSSLKPQGSLKKAFCCSGKTVPSGRFVVKASIKSIMLSEGTYKVKYKRIDTFIVRHCEAVTIIQNCNTILNHCA